MLIIGSLPRDLLSALFLGSLLPFFCLPLSPSSSKHFRPSVIIVDSGSLISRRAGGIEAGQIRARGGEGREVIDFVQDKGAANENRGGFCGPVRFYAWRWLRRSYVRLIMGLCNTREKIYDGTPVSRIIDCPLC